MGRFAGRSRRAIKKINSPSEMKKPDKSGEAETKDWNTENAAFVAAYNDLIDIEGVALEEYRLF